jgi:predicted DNA-binding transcriptional regulator AlpA
MLDEIGLLLRISQVCERARISKAHYFRLRAAGQGPCETRLGKRKVFVSEAALAEWLGKATQP